MILIFSQNHELTTQRVIDWLNHYNQPWFRINEDDEIIVEHLGFAGGLPHITLRVGGHLLDLSNVKSYWYRRGWFNITTGFNFVCKDAEVSYRIRKYMKEEAESLASFIFWHLRTHKHSLSDFFEAQNKKLLYLHLAQIAGLQVPPTFVTSNPAVLKRKLSTGPLITKSIHEVISFSYQNRSVFSFTSEVGAADVDDKESFFPSLFQDHIQKKLELRIFFLREEVYPMAIFSQENKNTNLDFRNYDNYRPNRNVPFRLPDCIVDKIKEFIRLSDLTTGSIDMLLSDKDEFLFLEVNPVGQFGMTSLPCNYSLEERVAHYLKDSYV